MRNDVHRVTDFIPLLLALFLASSATADDKIRVAALGGSSGSHRTRQMIELAKPSLESQGIEIEYTEEILSYNIQRFAKHLVADLHLRADLVDSHLAFHFRKVVF